MSRKEIQRERNEQCSERHALAVDRLRSMVSEETAAEKYRPFFRIRRSFFWSWKM